jgi:hypothetical protein
MPGNFNPNQAFTMLYRMAMFDTHSSSRIVFRLSAIAAGLFALTAAAALAQNQPEAIVPTRITQPINPDQRVTLQHNVHPLAQARFDHGAAPGAMSTGRIMLILKRSPAQDIALKQFLSDVQNPASPNYRKWLTPEQYGQRFGVSDTDLNTVTAWLQSQGFTIDKVPQARNVVIFSGNVAQVNQAFHTSIHQYRVNGETHFANSTDPQIPVALAPVVAGVGPLNDFRPKPTLVKGPSGHFDPASKTIKPDLTLSNSSGQFFLYVNPADAATIYDTPNPTLNSHYSGTKYDGKGVTLGIAGDSNVVMQDIINYRTAFLGESSSSVNTPHVIVDGNDPGIIAGDAVEALLDNEVAGGIAPGATINFYTAADNDFQNGLFLAIYRALDDNQVSILNVSFGACETSQGVGGNAQILAAWQQAAAQGISVTVSTGDSGSAGCDDQNTETQATQGLAVNGLASTPYNIAVGGTDFDILSTGLPDTSFVDPSSTYVDTSTSGTAPYYRTAQKYIPENPWNDSANLNAALTPSNSGYASNTPLKFTSNGQTVTTIAAAGGGVSSSGYCNGTVVQNNDGSFSCNGAIGPYPQPAFQTGVTNSVSTSARSLPDVSLLASDGIFGATWVICSDNVSNGDSSSTYTDCQTTNGQITQNTSFGGSGGTSAAAPAFAGMLALILQEEKARTGNPSLRLGQADYVLYNLEANGYASVFNDVTSGNNSVYCSGGTQANCGSNSFLTGYNAGAGYDAASGLGSVDVAKLIANWSKASFSSTRTALNITGFSNGNSATHGQKLTFSTTVTSSGGPTPTGQVSIINSSGVQNSGSIGNLTLSGGSANGTNADLPGGIYNVYAYYGGDVKNAASQSSGIQVTISPESSTTVIGGYIYDPIQGTASVTCDDSAGNACSGKSVPYGLVTAIDAQPKGASGSTSPASGNITFADSAGQLTYNGSTGSSVSVPIASNGLASFNNYYNQNQSLSVGSHSLTAAFGGNASYNASTSSAFTLTVTKGQTTTVAQATQKSGSTTVTLQAQINTDSIGLAPTGTVTFMQGNKTLGTVNTAAATGFVSNGSGKGSTVAALYQLQISSSQLSSAITPGQKPFPWGLSGGAVALAGLFFFAIPVRRRSWRSLLCLMVFAFLISGVVACGSSNNNNGGGNSGGSGTITASYSGDSNYSNSISSAVTIMVSQ